MTQPPIRWGIIGPGGIAQQFASALASLPEGRLEAVASRDPARAAARATELGAARSHSSYAALAADPDIDAVYVATPHSDHHGPARLCLEHGKAVLVEKPLTVNAAQAGDLMRVAADRGVFLMEAMWTRFLPVWQQVSRWLAEGAIGEPRLLTADFGFRTEWNPSSRLLNPTLAGGSLLDVGAYVISLAELVFSTPALRATGFAHIGATGVDEQAAFVLDHGLGRFALLSSAVRTKTPWTARIDGTEGSIEVPSFWCATHATLRAGTRQETIDLPLAVNGFEYEISEVHRCLRAGLTSSPRLPPATSLAIASTMDQLRRQWGLVYPGETP